MTGLAVAMSMTALVLYSASYFFNSKKHYLVLQICGNVFLSLSYLVIGAYFTMVSVMIGIVRGLVCYIYEKKDKKIPIYVVVGLCTATILSYLIINCMIIPQHSAWDIIYLFASCMYVITFAIRNISVMRYMVLIPHSCAILYNILIKAPISSAISYGIELLVTIIAIIKYESPQSICCNKSFLDRNNE